MTLAVIHCHSHGVVNTVQYSHVGNFVTTVIHFFYTQQWLLALDASCAQHVQSTRRMNLTVPRPSTKGFTFLLVKEENSDDESGMDIKSDDEEIVTNERQSLASFLQRLDHDDVDYVLDQTCPAINVDRQNKMQESLVQRNDRARLQQQTQGVFDDYKVVNRQKKSTENLLYQDSQ